MKNIRHLFQAIPMFLALCLFRALGPDRASDLGGWIGRTIGPMLGASGKACKNLRLAFPDMPDADCKRIIKEMWDNLGRVMAEYPHLREITLNRIEIVGEHHLDALGEHTPSIVISSHLANWELGPFYFNYKKQWPMTGLYRNPNNPYVAAMLSKARNPENRGVYIAKSSQGARDIVRAVKDGGRLGILIDQKYNKGIAVPFFGRPAMTSDSFSQLARRYDRAILPLQVERLKGCHFRITLHEPFKTEGRDDEEMVIHVHKFLEEWINKNPGQWLWLHRRWKSQALKNLENYENIVPQ